MQLIQLRDIRKTYTVGEVEVHALRSVSLDIDRGEYVALMGPSGSGKTTLMNTLGCLDRPTDGSYLLEGEEVVDMSGDERARLRNRKIGFVFQNFNLLSRTTAMENVELPLLYCGRFRGRPAAGARPAIAGKSGAGIAHGPPSLAAFRRPAAARGHRPRHGQRAADPPGRRADRQYRLAHQPRGYGSVSAAQPGRRHHDHFGNPRSRSRTGMRAARSFCATGR